MKRPHSAKPARQFWAQPGSDDHSTDQQVRLHTKVQRKQLHGVATSHDLSRLLPKKIQQDKERLYCEAIQLKTALNEMSEDNLRLRTRVAVLEKQKEKLVRIEDAAPRRGIPAARYDKENGIVAGLKKMIRQAKEQTDLAKAELSKIKKTSRYIKLNQLQIEKQTVIEENRNLSKHIEALLIELEKRERQDQAVRQLESELKATTTQLRSVTADNIRYEENLEDAQIRNKQLTDQLANVEKRWQRDLTLEKRKVNELQKNNQNMRIQISNLHQKFENQKKKPQPQPKAQKKQTRPVSSNPYKPSNSGRSLQNQKREALLVNQKLKHQLQEAKKKLAQSEDKLKIQPNHSTSFNKDQPIDFVLTKNEMNEFMDIDYKIKEEDEYSQQFQQSHQNKKSIQKGVHKQSEIMKQIQQMLTYRMKYNRYPFEELKADIEVSPMHSFTYEDLFNMLIGQPFFLTKQYATEFLKICFGHTKIDKNAELNSDVLISHLRQVIDDFQLLDQEEQEKMLYKLAEIMTRNRSKLEKQFAKVSKNGDFVTKDQIKAILLAHKEISLEQIELAICYIAVSSQSLGRINYIELLDKFFINNSRSLGEQSNFSSKHKGDKVDQEDLSLGENQDLDNGEPISGEEDII